MLWDDIYLLFFYEITDFADKYSKATFCFRHLKRIWPSPAMKRKKLPWTKFTGKMFVKAETNIKLYVKFVRVIPSAVSINLKICKIFVVNHQFFLKLLLFIDEIFHVFITQCSKWVTEFGYFSNQREMQKILPFIFTHRAFIAFKYIFNYYILIALSIVSRVCLIKPHLSAPRNFI